MAQVRVRRSAFAVPLAAVADAVASPDAGDVTISAASTATESPRARFALGAGLFVIVSAVAAVVLDNAKVLSDPLKLGADMNAFALIYVATQAVERLLEPISYYVHPVEKEKAAAKGKIEDVGTAPDLNTALAAAKDAANKVAKVNMIQSERAILFWVAASLAGVVISAWLGLYFVSMLLDESSRAAVPRSFDVVATGLTIGGGTKAVHGLIEKLGKPKPATDEA